MPELPEVETIVRTLRPLVQGKTILRAQALNPGSVEGPHALTALVGGRIRELGRRGKLALLYLDGVAAQTEQIDGLAVHLKMTGRLFVYPKDTATGPHTRAVLDLDDGSRLFFDDARKFGYLRVLSARSLSDWGFWQKLGPEPLELDATAFAALFRHRGAGMKSLLLNQAVVAGIGNIYADESLFRAAIHPATKGTALNETQLRVLHGHLVDVLTESIEACGSSIRDYRTARGDAGAFQNAFRVYGRTGKPCVCCGAELQGVTVAGRTTVFCPNCQNQAE